MKRVSRFLSLVFLLLALAGVAEAKEWRGIVPMHSTRADVERLLGKAKDNCECTYSFPDVNVLIQYSDGNCKNGGAWNVPKDTVINLSIYPAVWLRLSDLKIVDSQFQIKEDPELPGIFWYSNNDDGFIVVVENGLATAFYYVGNAKDQLLRCPPRRA